MRKRLTHNEASGGRRAGPLRVLFICSRNRKRSPTAERLFSGLADLDVASAGLAPDADEVVTPEALEWAELILVMEKAHRARLGRQFDRHLLGTRMICLDIPDHYEFMDEALGRLLNARASPHLFS